jgi:hypothetical protein
MIEPVVAFFEKLIDQFTWRRFVFVSVLCILVTSGLWTYEAYTQHFKLNRIERQIDLLEKFVAAKSKLPATSTPELRAIEDAIQAQLRETTRTSSTEYELLPWAKKVIAATLVWIVFGFFIALIPSSYTNTEPATASVVAGITVFASPFIAASTLLPTNPWINYVAYPIGHVFVVFIGLSWLMRKVQRWLVRRRQSDSSSR